MERSRLLALRKSFLVAFLFSSFLSLLFLTVPLGAKTNEVARHYNVEPTPPASATPGENSFPISQGNPRDGLIPLGANKNSQGPFAVPTPSISPTPTPSPASVPPKSEPQTETTLYLMSGISVATSFSTFLGFLSTTLLAWRKEHREQEAMLREREKAQRDLEKAQREARTAELDEQIKQHQLLKMKMELKQSRPEKKSSTTRKKKTPRDKD